MPYITKIPLGKIKVVPNLKNARVGALLQGAPPQIRTGNGSPAAEVFLRCSLKAADVVYDGVVSLEGASAGKFFNDADLNIEPTIDISDLAHVVLDDPAPRNNSAANRIKAGGVCQASDSAGNTFLCIAAAVQDLQPEPRIFGYVRLDGAQCGDITTNVSSQLYIGRAAVVPLDGTGTN
jgi:hypothetical protein